MVREDVGPFDTTEHPVKLANQLLHGNHLTFNLNLRSGGE